MKREDALDALEVVMKRKWEDAKKAFDRSHAGATSDQARAESKYDTRGLEESYLANGLAKAVSEYEVALADLDSCRTLKPKAQVGVGALIRCEGEAEMVSFLLSRSGGGIEAAVAGEEITVITPESPLAQKLMGLTEGERISAPPFKILEVL